MFWPKSDWIIKRLYILVTCRHSRIRWRSSFSYRRKQVNSDSFSILPTYKVEFKIQIYGTMKHKRQHWYSSASSVILTPWGPMIFTKPVAYLFNKYLATFTVPRQRKTARIQPFSKVNSPKVLADYRSIFCYTNSYTYHRESYCVTFSIICPSCSTSRSLFQWSIRLPSRWINHNTAQYYLHLSYSTLCYCDGHRF